MADVKIIAVVAAVVVVVAGIGAALLLNNNGGGDDTKDTPPTDVKLLLYGNANGDDTIDENDTRIVKKVYEGEEDYTLENYPLADANHNGKIDEGDITIVEKLEKREATECFVIAQLDEDDDTDYSVVKINYPLRHAVSINAEVTSVMIQLGVAPYMAGYLSTKYGDNDLYPLEQAGAKALNLASNRTIKETAYAEIIDLDTRFADEGGVGAIFIYNTNALGNYKSDLGASGAGIPVIHTKCTNPQDALTGFRTFGFIFGTDGENQGRNIANYTEDVLNNVENVLSSNGITGDKLKNALVLFSKTSIADENSQYTYATQRAGGNVINHQSGASSKLTNSESILTFSNPVPDYIINFTTQGHTLCSDAYVVGTIWEIDKLNYLSSSPAYHNLVYINASMSVSARIAYIAEVLYPSLFAGYGDNIWQGYVDSFLGFLNTTAPDGDFDVKVDATTVITYADYRAAGGTK